MFEWYFNIGIYAMPRTKPNNGRPKKCLNLKPHERRLLRKSRPPDIHKQNYALSKPCFVKLKRLVAENIEKKIQPISSSSNKNTINPCANKAVISIRPNTVSYEDFRNFTNIETLVRDDIKRRLKNAEIYLKNIETYIKKYYHKHFVALDKWPRKIKCWSANILKLDDFVSVQGLNNNVHIADKESDVNMRTRVRSVESNLQDIQNVSFQTNISTSHTPKTQSLAEHFPDTNSALESSETRSNQCIERLNPVSKDTLTPIADENDVCIKQENSMDVTNDDLEMLRALAEQIKTESNCSLAHTTINSELSANPSSDEHLSVGDQTYSEEPSPSHGLQSSESEPVSVEHPVSEENSSFEETSPTAQHITSDEFPCGEENRGLAELSPSEVHSSSKNEVHSSSKKSLEERQNCTEAAIKLERQLSFEAIQTGLDIENNANNHNTTVPTTNQTNSDRTSDDPCKSEPTEEPPEFLPSLTRRIIINDKEPTVENLLDEMMANPVEDIKTELEVCLSNKLSANENVINAGVYTIIHSSISHEVLSKIMH